MTSTSNAQDPRRVLAGAVEQASTVVAGVKPDQYADPTPCDEFDVATLMNHLIGAVDRAGGLARGVQVTGQLEPDASVPEGGFESAIKAAGRSTVESWTDDALLGQEFVLPWATMPGAGIVMMYSLETVLHSWDLAVATGQEHLLDHSLADAVAPAAHQFLPPEHRGGEIPFAAVVEVDEPANATDRLAGYTGRRKV